MKKVIFKIDKDLDFKNHLIGARITEDIEGISQGVSEYYKKLRKATKKEQREIFEKKTSKFYSYEMKDFRNVMVKQIQEMWDIIEDEYISRMEKIHKNKFPFEVVCGILTTAPFGYGYNFDEKTPWFACGRDNPTKAVHTAMHEIMHAFFKYFTDFYKEKYDLNEEQVWEVKEALTIILNLEFEDLRMNTDKGHPEHKKLREKIKENWLKYKNLEKILD